MEGRPHTVAIIQARMTSTRLPGKVLKPLLGEPMLCWVVERLKRARTLDRIVIATTTDPEDDAIVAQCQLHNYPCYRGSRDDVLDRYYHAATDFQAETIVRITSDCPLIDPDLVDEVVELYHSARPECDYASNAIPVRTFPRGLDCEVFSYDALGIARKEADEPAQREHVTPYLYQNHEQFSLRSFQNPVDHSSWRWTVDTPEDFELIERICQSLEDRFANWQTILTLCQDHPDWAKLNAHVEQKKL
ncbi:cytidylyltransferase domain-containing protein [Rubinisphaera margarita]|uniref:cytidylyltransferase domain-containing protein n=1 Tax=Rubinisphaera margarita TaxID=2909586 RepID=UPI001EE9847D|nr:glycosyltransferase family protein [Rubinisphaera margarita]MCG6157323.1 glycosyltransferase family protein [Rubinisphaera margarita]